TYDLVLTRLEMQIAWLFELQSALGSMRKELPPFDPLIHSGWVLVPRPTLGGDIVGKKLAKGARKRLEQIAIDHAGTPWAVLAHRLKVTALGLDWRAVR